MIPEIVHQEMINRNNIKNKIKSELPSKYKNTPINKINNISNSISISKILTYLLLIEIGPNSKKVLQLLFLLLELLASSIFITTFGCKNISQVQNT